MCLTLSKYIFSRSIVLWENHSIENFLSQKSCISSQFTPRSNKSSEATSQHFSVKPNKSSEAPSTTACFDFSPHFFSNFFDFFSQRFFNPFFLDIFFSIFMMILFCNFYHPLFFKRFDDILFTPTFFFTPPFFPTFLTFFQLF